MKQPKTRRENEIWQACDALVAEGILGHKVTGDMLREKLLDLGHSKGSPNEIYKYRRNWREARGIVEEDFSRSQNDALALSDPIVRAAEAIRKEIEMKATAAIEKMRHEAELQVNSCQGKLDERERDLKQLSENNKELAFGNTELKGESRTLQAQLFEEKQKTSVLEQSIRSSAVALQKFEREADRLLVELKQSHLETCEGLKDRLKDSEAYYQKEIDKYREIYEKQRHEWMVVNDGLKVTHQRLEVKNVKTELQLSEAYQKIQLLTKTLNQLELKVEELKADRRHQEEALKASKLASAAVEEAVKQKQYELENLKTVQDESQQALENKMQLIGKLEEQNRALQDLLQKQSTEMLKARHAE